MSSREVGIETARKTLGDLVNEVRYSGTHIILTRNGKPAARLTPLEPTMTTYTAEVSASPAVALTEMLGVTVVNDGDVRDGMENAETTLRADGDHTRTQIISAAEEVLTANGWTITGEWEDGDNSYYAPAARVDS